MSDKRIYCCLGMAMLVGMSSLVPFAIANAASTAEQRQSISEDRTSEQASRHAVTLSDLQKTEFEDVTMDLAPDGQTLAYSLSSDGTVWIVGTHAGAIPRRIGRGFLPRWSPKGEKIAFYSVGEGGPQLAIFDLVAQSVTQVTHVAGGIDPDPTTRILGPVHEAFSYSWSPDGGSLVFASRVALAPTVTRPDKPGDGAGARNAAEPLILTNSTPPDWTLSGIYVHSSGSVGLAESKDGHSYTMKANADPGEVLTNQLFVVDAGTGQLRRLTDDNVSYFQPDWSPDGKMIVCASSDHEGPVFGSDAINVYTIDAATGKRRAVTSGGGVRSRPTWSPDGQHIAYLGRHSFFGHSAVFVGSRSGRDFVNVTSKLDRYVTRFVWAESGRALLITYRNGVSSPLGKIIVDSGEFQGIVASSDAEPVGSVGVISSSRSGAMAWQQSDANHPGTIQFLARDTSSPSQLLDLYPQVQQWNLGVAERIRWRNERGDELEGMLLKPANYVAGQRYPLIVDAYPLAGGIPSLSPMMGNQAWASMGYAIFRPSPRAPHVWVNPWKSEESSLAGKGPNGWDVTVDDVLSGVDELIDRGIADPDRMCLYGFSNGATVVNYLVTRTNRFKCAVSVASSLSDWVWQALRRSDDTVTTLAGVALWDAPAAYIKLSAVFHLDKVSTPMLLAAGDNDRDFLLGTIRMYNGLRQVGADVTLLRYPDQGHGFDGAAMKDFWKREIKFFGKYLGAPKAVDIARSE